MSALPLTHANLSTKGIFTISSVQCDPGTLYLGLTLTNQTNDHLYIEFNNYWQVLTPHQTYSWENNSKYQPMNISLLGKKLIKIQGYTNFYNNKFFLEDSTLLLNITTDNIYPESTWGVDLHLATGESYSTGEITPAIQREKLPLEYAPLSSGRIDTTPKATVATFTSSNLKGHRVINLTLIPSLNPAIPTHKLTLILESPHGKTSTWVSTEIWCIESKIYTCSSGEDTKDLIYLKNLLVGSCITGQFYINSSKTVSLSFENGISLSQLGLPE